MSLRISLRQVAAGERHSAALTFGGNVYVWGCRANGALGLPALGGRQDDAYTSVLVPRPLPV